MKKYLIDSDGEVLYEFGDFEQICIYNVLNTKRKNIENKLFFKLYRDSILIFQNESINIKTFITFFKLISLLDFGTNEFASLNGIPANLKQIYTYFNMNNKTFYNHIRVLETLEIVKKVHKGRETNILINPYFIGYGTNNTDEALKIFGKSIWAKSSCYSKNKRRINYVKR